MRVHTVYALAGCDRLVRNNLARHVYYTHGEATEAYLCTMESTERTSMYLSYTDTHLSAIFARKKSVWNTFFALAAFVGYSAACIKHVSSISATGLKSMYTLPTMYALAELDRLIHYLQLAS